MPGLLDFTTQEFSARVIVRKEANYTVLVTDEHVQMNGAYTATLFPLNSLQGTTYARKALKIENIGTSDVTVQPGTNTVTAVADTIDSKALFTLKPNEFIIISGGEADTDWKIVSPIPKPALTRVPFVVVQTTSGTSATNVFDANGAPTNLEVKEITVNALDTIAANITVTNGTTTMVTIAKGTTLSAIVPATTIVSPVVASGATFTVTSSNATGTARVTITGTIQKYV